MKKSVTTVSIDPALRILCKEKKLKPSRILHEALIAKFTAEEYAAAKQKVETNGTPG